MAWPTSVFPTALDSTIFPADKVDNVDYPVANDWNGFKDVLINVQSTMGVSGSAVAATLDYKLKNTSSSNPGHKHTLVNGATDITATAAELNLLDNTVAGTAVASRALALGADKNVDVLAVADLKLGAGAGTSVSSTAAELNLLDTAITSVIQVVNTQIGAVATGTTVMVQDDTIPQKTEGDEYMTLAITPKSVTNVLKIEVCVHFACSIANTRTFIALFQDTTASALAAGGCAGSGAANAMVHGNLTHYMAAGTTSETTFKVRLGPEAGTLTFNGQGGSRLFGGVLASSITITEFKA